MWPATPRQTGRVPRTSPTGTPVSLRLPAAAWHSPVEIDSVLESLRDGRPQLADHFALLRARREPRGGTSQQRVASRQVCLEAEFSRRRVSGRVVNLPVIPF